jgi:hypothetical protein
MKRASIREITKVASEVRKYIIDSMITTHGQCYEASTCIAEKLQKLGYASRLIQGNVLLDGEGCFGKGFHYWLEVEDCVIDVTGDQFNEEIGKGKIPAVVVLPYTKLPRYRRAACENVYKVRKVAKK